MPIRTGPLFATLALVTLAACAGDPFGGGPGAGTGPAAGVEQTTVAPDTPAYFREEVGDRVFFALDRSSLSEAARATLREQAAWLKENPEFEAVIEGHADERGTREYNLALGAARANSARDYLIAQGVAPERLRTVSFGKERPVALCSEERCYSQNRRAVTVLSAPTTG